MGHARRAALACAAVVISIFAGAGVAQAMKPDVCASKCAYTSINAAIAAASEGATITIGKGSFTENVVPFPGTETNSMCPP